MYICLRHCFVSELLLVIVFSGGGPYNSPFSSQKCCPKFATRCCPWQGTSATSTHSSGVLWWLPEADTDSC